MNICIKQIEQWLDRHAKTKQWLWFVALWLAGLTAVTLLSYPIRWVVRTYMA
jgi:uncharacterized membrane protein